MGLIGFGVGNLTGEFHHQAIETALETRIARPRIETALVIAIDLRDVRIGDMIAKVSRRPSLKSIHAGRAISQCSVEQ